MFTLEERRHLQDFGYLLLEHLATITTSTTLYGTSTLLFSLSAFIVLERRVKSPGRSILLCTTALSFLLATAHWAATISTLVLFIRKALIADTLGLLDEAGSNDFARHLSILNAIANWIVPFLMIVNDSVVAWRAWVLCTGHRRLMIGPMLLLLGTYMMSFVFVALSTDPRFKANTGRKTYAIGALSVSTNASSTLVIAHRLWAFRNAWTVGLDAGWSYAQKVLLIIVESGALYFVLQVRVKM